MGLNGLDFQVVDVPFTKGLDTKTNEKLVLPGKWTNLLNLTLTRDGTPRVRDGITPLVGTGHGNGLALYNNELLTIKGPTVSSVSTAASIANPVPGELGFVGVSKTEVERSTGSQDEPDCATGNGYTCYAWREKSPAYVAQSVNCALIDEATGSRLIDSTAMRTSAGVFGVRVVFVGSAFFIFYILGTSLYCRVISTAAPTVLGAEVALITSANLGALSFDACAFNGGVMVMYAWTDGVTSVRTIGVTRAGTVPSISNGPTNLFTNAAVPVGTITAMSCAVFASGSAAGFVTSTGAAAMCGLAGVAISTAYAVNAGPAQISAAVGATNAFCHLTAVADGVFIRVFRDFISEYATNALVNIVSCVVDNAMFLQHGPTNIQPSACFAGAGVARGPQGPFIHGKAFSTGGRIFLPVFVAGTYTSLGLATSNPRTQNSQNTFFVLDCGPLWVFPATVGSAVVVGKALYGSYGTAVIAGTPRVVTPCSSAEVLSGVFATMAGELTQLVLTNQGFNFSPTGLVRLAMTPNFSLPTSRKQLGESTYVAGGSLSTYDGSAVAEHGFPLFPEGISVTANGAGTGSVTDGVHQICVVYEWVDNAGQRHQSAPSPAVQATLATGANSGSFTVSVPSMLLSQKAGIILVAYMTQAAGLTFNRVLLDNAAFAPVVNTTAATTGTITIDDSDATIAANELLYTQPNQSGTTLPNIAPGPMSALTVAHNRLWFDKTDQPGAFGFSQEYINNVGLQFSPDLGGTLPLDAGPIAAIAELDEKIIFFTAKKPFVVFGTGPNAAGGFSNYSRPQELPSDVGCSDSKSILRMPQGLVFKAQKGWYLLSRDLNIKFIGDAVERWNGQAVTAAVILNDRQECRFLTNGSLGAVTLVYSYDSGQWSYFQKSGLSYAPVDAVWWPIAASGAGAYVHISLANGLNQSLPSATTDAPGVQAPAGIPTIARTAFLRPGQLEKFARIRRLYLTASADAAPTSTLVIDVDFDDAYGGVAPGSYSVTVPLATAFPTYTGMPIDLRHKLRHQKCKSVAFTFTEVAGVSSARLTGIQALALEVGLKRGVNKLKSGQTV